MREDETREQAVPVAGGALARAWHGLHSTDTGRLAIITAQLTVLMAALFRFRIEQTFGLPRLLPLILVGFVVHALLPTRYRLQFFLLLSLAAIGIILPFPHSLILILIGLGLIGICHLPVPYWLRILLLAAAGAVLAGVRMGWLSAESMGTFPTLVLPILGAMFMFRLVIYVYDLMHEAEPVPVWHRLSYFFMLPNTCFLLFPVVDYRTFCRTYYDADEQAIYQKGVFWIFRGLTHLLGYRIVYQYFVPAPDQIVDVTGVAVYMVTSFLLYLRISGQFHIIIGVLCLFGFNLPETHHLYYLASSFNGLWRRINIYWKDFMMKVLYYPSFVRLKSFGMMTGIALATLIVFAGTWVLHSYQWFWLRGTFPITATDGIFWGMLALFVVINSLWEASGRQAKKRSGEFEFGAALSLSARTAGFFCFFCVLWSFWAGGSVGEWIVIVSRAANGGISAYLTLIGIYLALVAAGVAIQYALAARKQPPARGPVAVGGVPALRASATVCVLLVLTLPNLPTPFGRDVEQVVDTIRQNSLNLRDRELAERSYYEGLLEGGDFTTQLWIATAGRPTGKEWTHTRNSNVVHFVDDFLEYELRPSYSGTYKDAPFETNQWGFRGRDYELEKPPGVFRVALIGASYELGAGVPNEATMDAVAEARWNEETNGEGRAYEILNFSVGGYGMAQKFRVTEVRAAPFEPDLVVLTLYPTEPSRTLGHLANAVLSEVPIPYPELEELIRQTGVHAGMSQAEIEQRLRPVVYDAIEWSLVSFERWSRETGTELLTVYLPVTEYTRSGSESESQAEILGRARKAGLDPLIVENVFEGYALDEVELAPWDNHLSALGHELMGEKLYEVLSARYR